MCRCPAQLGRIDTRLGTRILVLGAKNKFDFQTNHVSKNLKVFCELIVNIFSEVLLSNFNRKSVANRVGVSVSASGSALPKR